MRDRQNDKRTDKSVEYIHTRCLNMAEWEKGKPPPSPSFPSPPAPSLPAYRHAHHKDHSQFPPRYKRSPQLSPPPWNTVPPLRAFHLRPRSRTVRILEPAGATVGRVALDFIVAAAPRTALAAAGEAGGCELWS